MGELETLIDGDPRIFQNLAKFIDVCRSPLGCLRQLGLSSHPSCAVIKGTRDPIITKIVYHADPYMLYQFEPPSVLPDNPGDGPAGIAQQMAVPPGVGGGGGGGGGHEPAEGHQPAEDRQPVSAGQLPGVA